MQDFKGIVTIDSMGRQTGIAKAIVAQEADLRAGAQGQPRQAA